MLVAATDNGPVIFGNFFINTQEPGEIVLSFTKVDSNISVNMARVSLVLLILSVSVTCLYATFGGYGGKVRC